MSEYTKKDYYAEAVSNAAEECEAVLTAEQCEYLAGAFMDAHETIGQAFYTPPASDRYAEIESEWKKKYNDLKAEFDRYRGHSERAVKESFGLHPEDQVSIGPRGQVLLHDGQGGRRIQ